jgi:hypothetical protein
MGKMLDISAFRIIVEQGTTSFIIQADYNMGKVEIATNIIEKRNSYKILLCYRR